MEIVVSDAGNAVPKPCVSVGATDVYVRNVNALIEASAVISTAPPRLKRLVRGERPPTDIAIAETHTAVPEAEPCDQRRRPVVMAAQYARIPTPAEPRVPKPAAIVIRCPAPGVVADPCPPIPVFPRPAAAAIRRPIDANGHGRPPHVPIRRDVRPCAVVVEFFGSVNAFRNILRAGGLGHRAVAILVPVVPFVEGGSVDDLELRIGRRAPSDHHLTGPDPFGAARGEHLDLARPSHDLGLPCLVHGNPVTSAFIRTYGENRSIYFNFGGGRT